MRQRKVRESEDMAFALATDGRIRARQAVQGECLG